MYGIRKGNTAGSHLVHIVTLISSLLVSTGLHREKCTVINYFYSLGSSFKMFEDDTFEIKIYQEKPKRLKKWIFDFMIEKDSLRRQGAKNR